MDIKLYLCSFLQMSASPPRPDIETLFYPETVVEAINLDCYNQFYPSDTNCAGPWQYYDHEWKEDKSISIHCTGEAQERTIY